MNKCDCNDNRKIRIVSGNDLTVEAVVSVWDAKECVYVPMNLTGASDVALNMVTTFTKVHGEEVSASGSRVSAFFPAGRLGKGVYGVEITFRDADGRCRAFERSLIEVVESSGEATVESTAEGETGDGLNITVDVRTRTVRIGDTRATDYPCVETTWAELKALRDNGKLSAGRCYRITDYVTTTTQADTMSAVHAFDIVVVATGANTLSEDALAVLHKGDTYFSSYGAHLDGWSLKYCLDNSPRFAWADADNGKGVIWWMRDEWNNEAFYDFKNIMFKRSIDWFYTHQGFVYEDNFKDNPVTKDIFFYTFSWVDENKAVWDASTVGQTIPDDEEILIGVTDNHIGFSNTSNGVDDTELSFDLSDNVFMSTYSYEGLKAFHGLTGNRVEGYHNTFGNNNNNNVIKGRRNVFWNNCDNNKGSIDLGEILDSSSDNVFKACYNLVLNTDSNGNHFYNSRSIRVNNARNCVLLPGIVGNASKLLEITFEIKDYPQFAGLDSSGNLKIWAPADQADKAEVSQLNNGSTVTYSGENDAIYVANSGKEITNLKVTCTTPADPVNPTMDSLKTREAKFMFECGPNAAITFENVQWNDWDAPDFNTASHCICEISIMYVSGLKKFIGRYTTYPPTHLTPPSWSLEDYTTFGANDTPYIEVTDNDDVGWKAEYPDWMFAEAGIDSGTGSGGISFQFTNDGAARDGYMTLKSADGRKVFVQCYVMQEGVQP